jgi:hypothetical protein
MSHRPMYRPRIRIRLPFATTRRRGAAALDTWATLLLNCPKCGQHLAPRAARETVVYACADHGELFVAAEDGRLYDVPKLKHQA